MYKILLLNSLFHDHFLQIYGFLETNNFFQMILWAPRIPLQSLAYEVQNVSLQMDLP